jgi:ankyrin repeat protein
LAACYEGHTYTIRLLYELGCDLNQTDDDGDSALEVATQESQIDALRVLYELGANISEYIYESLLLLALSSPSLPCVVFVYCIHTSSPLTFADLNDGDDGENVPVAVAVLDYTSYSRLLSPLDRSALYSTIDGISPLNDCEGLQVCRLIMQMKENVHFDVLRSLGEAQSIACPSASCMLVSPV